MPRKPKAVCEGIHDLNSLIKEASSIKDLNKRISDWPSGPFIGRSEKSNEAAALKEARDNAEFKAREAADDWCKARPACADGNTCHIGKLVFDAPVVYSPALEEYVAYLTVKKIECKCIRV